MLLQSQYFLIIVRPFGQIGYQRRLFVHTSCDVSTESPTNRRMLADRSTEARCTNEGARLFYFVIANFVKRVWVLEIGKHC